MADETTTFRLDLDNKDFLVASGKALEAIKGLGEQDNLSGLLSGLGKVTAVLGVVSAAVLAFKVALDMTKEGEQIKQVNNQFEILAAQSGVASDKLRKGLEASSRGLIDNTELLKIANKAMIDMGGSAQKLPQLLDLARKTTSVFGGDLKSNFEALSFAINTGNTRALKHLGIVVDQDKAYRTYAASIGVISSELSQAGRQQAVLNAVLAEGGDKFKNVSEALDTSTTNIQRLSVAFNQLKEVIAVLMERYIAPFLNRLVKDFTEGLSIITGFIDKWTGHTSKAVEEQSKVIAESVEKTVEASKVENEQVLKHRTKFYADLIALKQRNVNDEIAVSQSVEETERLQLERRELSIRESEARVAEIRANTDLTLPQRAQMIEQVWQQMDNNIAAMDMNLEQERLNALDNYQRKSESTAQGISRAFQAGSQRNKMALSNFGNAGQKVYESFSKHAVNSLQELGAGTKSATQIMKGFFFGMLADQAEQYGTWMMLSSVWPPNPPAFAAGAALLVLSGFLRSQAGGGGGGGGGGASGAGGGATGGGVDMGATVSAQQQQAPRKAITVQVMGNYFETEQTKARLLDMIRDATDVTDFKYVQIGNK